MGVRLISPVKTKSAFLSCNHTRSYEKKKAPQAAEQVWCFKCQRHSIVMHLVLDFCVKCATCRYTRNFGAARLNAEIGATRHHRRFPHHVVNVYKGDDLHRKFGNSDTPLPVDDSACKSEIPSDIPPF